MSEALKTAGFVAGAVALVITAAVVEPERRTPAMFSDEGEAFYPKFRDPQSVKAIEVIDYDESTATARPLNLSRTAHTSPPPPFPRGETGSYRGGSSMSGTTLSHF